MILVDVLSITEFILPPSNTLDRNQNMLNRESNLKIHRYRNLSIHPHPMQTVRATQKLLDQLFVGQTRDVGGANGDLGLPTYCQGLMRRSIRLFLHWRCFLLNKEDRGITFL